MLIRKFLKYLKVSSLDGTDNSHDCVELQLIRGVHNNTSSHPSIIHFSFNKAATQYVKSILVACATEAGMTHAGINEYAFNTTFPFLDHLSADEMQQYRHIFKERGYLYSVFGGMVEGIPNLDAYKIVLGVRDPRDILVSSYFSQAFSHPVPTKSGSKHDAFMRRRQRALESGIDQYVLDESIRVNAIFQKYYRLLLAKHPTVFVTRYEDMVADFPSWLDSLLAYCELHPGAALRKKIVDEHLRLKPTQEHIDRHIRKGRAGDYLEKLKPETILRLNEILSATLHQYGYAG